MDWVIFALAMQEKKTFWSRFCAIFDILFLIIGCVLGIAGAYLLGHVFGMGAKGYAIGFILGFGIGYGAISF